MYKGHIQQSNQLIYRIYKVPLKQPHSGRSSCCDGEA